MESKKRGRKPKPNSEKVKMCSAYLLGKEHKAIIKKYGSLTKAIRLEIIPKI
jgi:hypothetical protein